MTLSTPNGDDERKEGESGNYHESGGRESVRAEEKADEAQRMAIRESERVRSELRAEVQDLRRVVKLHHRTIQGYETVFATLFANASFASGLGDFEFQRANYLEDAADELFPETDHAEASPTE